MTIHINLLSWRETKQQETHKKIIFLLGASLLALLFIVAACYFVLLTKISVQSKRNAYIKNETRLLEQLFSKETSWVKNKKNLLEQAESIKQLQTNSIEIIKILDALPRWVPEDVFLTNFSLAGNQVLLQGKAKNHELIALMIRNIEKEKWLKSLQLSLIQNESLLHEYVAFGLRAIDPVWQNDK